MADELVKAEDEDFGIYIVDAHGPKSPETGSLIDLHKSMFEVLDIPEGALHHMEWQLNTSEDVYYKARDEGRPLQKEEISQMLPENQ